MTNVIKKGSRYHPRARKPRKTLKYPPENDKMVADTIQRSITWKSKSY